ncbi:amidohydrolase family protein [Streptomyces tanashiensis]
MSADSEQPQPPEDGAATTADSTSLLLSHARLTDGRTVDVRLAGGRIEAVGTAGSLTAVGARVDLTGYLLLPAAAEDPRPRPRHRALRRHPRPRLVRPEEVRRQGHRGGAAPARPRRDGAPRARASATSRDSARSKPCSQARRSLRGLADLTAVAVPRLLTGVAGADGLAMLRDAGGGCRRPAWSAAARTSTRTRPATWRRCSTSRPSRASRWTCTPTGTTRPGSPGSRRWPADCWPGVTIGPCAGLASLPRRGTAGGRPAGGEYGVTVVCLPQGGWGTELRGAAPVRLLRSAGVRVAAGSGALRDVANPVGRGDPLEAAYLLASLGGLPPGEAYGAVAPRRGR